MRNYLENESTSLWKANIHRHMRYYGGGSSSGSGNNFGKTTSSGGGNTISSSTSNAQLTPDQVLKMYGTALPSMVNATNTGVNNSIISPSLTAANKGATEGVNAININGLSPGEANAVERSTNQGNTATGNLGLFNPTNTVTNAMNFGQAYNDKLARLNTATQTAAGVAGQNANAFGTVGAAFNPISSNANTANSKSNSNAIFSNVSNGLNVGQSQNSSDNIGCFLTTACCEHKGLPDDCEELTVLRNFRDTFVPKDMVEEYYQVAPNIVLKITGNQGALDYVYNVVRACVEDIKNDRKESAMNRYVDMVNTLREA